MRVCVLERARERESVCVCVGVCATLSQLECAPSVGCDSWWV